MPLHCSVLVSDTKVSSGAVCVQFTRMQLVNLGPYVCSDNIRGQLVRRLTFHYSTRLPVLLGSCFWGIVLCDGLYVQTHCRRRKHTVWHCPLCSCSPLAPSQSHQLGGVHSQQLTFSTSLKQVATDRSSQKPRRAVVCFICRWCTIHMTAL